MGNDHPSLEQIVERAMRVLDKNGPPSEHRPDLGPCWELIGRRKNRGYRRVAYMNAHRAFYIYFVGPIPEGKVLDHLCRNRGCVNPTHVEPVTNRENILRGISVFAREAAQTHCKRGHPFSGANLVIKTRNGRQERRCRECHNEGMRRRRSAVPTSSQEERK